MRWFLLLLLSWMTVSCSHQQTKIDLNERFNLPQASGEKIDEIPSEMNALVQKWLDYYQNRGRDHMETYLGRSTRYIGLMKNILRENGVPEDLVYVALIESGFSPTAHSRARAVGFWQFIEDTGKRYGLRVDTYVDDRRDPIMATRAAALYLKGLYQVFGSWHLALASYNAGENRIKREVMENYTRDLWVLIKKGTLPEETINYVPKFIAARMIALNPEKYGFNEIAYEEPISFIAVPISRTVNLEQLADNLNVSYAELKRLNPRYKKHLAPVAAGRVEELRIPGQLATQVIAALSQSYTTLPPARSPATYALPKYHLVQRGETLASIAAKYAIKPRDLAKLNRFQRKSTLMAGSKLKLPPKNDEWGVAIHIVKSGETLAHLADRYRVPVRLLAQSNNISLQAQLYVGTRLVIPASEND